MSHAQANNHRVPRLELEGEIRTGKEVNVSNKHQRVGAITQDTQTGSLVRIRVIRMEGGALVSLGGRLRIDSSPELRNQLLAVLYGETLENLVIDLSCVPYIDLSGVATLLEALRVARGRNTGLQLKGLHDRPRYLMEVTGLLSLFETCRGMSASSLQKAQ